MSFREPRTITDLAEFAGEYIEFSRAQPDQQVCERLIDYAALFFADVPITARQLDALMVMVVDRVYLYSAELAIYDETVNEYFIKVTRYLLDLLAARGCRVFYVLDNQMRQDRFEIAVALLSCAGLYVVTPYRGDGVFDFPEIRHALQVQVLAGRHVAYIEKDGTVNHLASVVALAKATDRLVIYRNEGPEHHRVEHIASLRTTAPS